MALLPLPKFSKPSPTTTPTADDIERQLQNQSRLKGIGRVLRKLGLMRLEDTEDVGLENLKVKMGQAPQDVLGGLRKIGRNPDSETFLKSLKPDIDEGGLNTIFGTPPPVIPPPVRPPPAPLPAPPFTPAGELKPVTPLPTEPVKPPIELSPEQQQRQRMSLESELARQGERTPWWLQGTDEEFQQEMEVIREARASNAASGLKSFLYEKVQRPLEQVPEFRRDIETLSTLGAMAIPETTPFQDMTPQQQVLTLAGDVAVSIPWGSILTQAGRMGLKQMGQQEAMSLYNKTFGASLDSMIARRARGVPPEQFNAFQNAIYNRFAANKPGVQAKATERMLSRMGRPSNNVEQVIKDAVDDTIADIEGVFIPRGTQTGAMKFGGLPKKVPAKPVTPEVTASKPVRKLEVGSTAELGIEQGKPFIDDFGHTWTMGKEAGVNQFKLDTVVQGQRISIWARKESGWLTKRTDALAKLEQMEAIPEAKPVMSTREIAKQVLRDYGQNMDKARASVIASTYEKYGGSAIREAQSLFGKNLEDLDLEQVLELGKVLEKPAISTAKPQEVAKEPWEMTRAEYELENDIEEPSGYLYHGTPKKNLEDIRNRGLESKTRQRNDWEEGDRTPQEQELLYFERKENKNWGGKQSVQLRINEDLLPSGVDITEDALRPAEFYTSHLRNESYSIPPEAIEYYDVKTKQWIPLVEGEHLKSIRQALSEGKPVPAEVLKDYPDLAQQFPQPAKGVTPVTPEVTSWFISTEGKVAKTQFRTLSTMTGGGANLLQTPEGQLIERIATGKQKGWWKTIIGTTEYVGKTPERVVEIARKRGAIIPEAKALVPVSTIPTAETVTPKPAPVTPKAVKPGIPEEVAPTAEPITTAPESAVSPSVAEGALEAGEGVPPPADIVPPSPPEPPIDIIPPPTTPAPGERIMGDLQNADELVTTMTNPDVFRKLARLPGLRSVLKYLNPAGVAESPAAKAVIARAALREEGQNKAIGAFSTLEQLGKRGDVWGKIDDAGRITSGKLEGKLLDEVLTFRSKYATDMTPEQKAWADQFHAIERDKLDFLKRNGITINELNFEEGGEYVGRRVAGRLDDTGNLAEAAFIGSPGPGRPGMKMGAEKTRVFKDINEAVEQGYRYLPADEALFLNIKGAYNRVADKQMADWVLERIPWRTSVSPETLIIARDQARLKVAISVRLKNLLNRAVRGERIPIDSTLAKTLPDETAELRSLVDLLQTGEPIAERVMALTEKLNTIVKQAKTDMRDASDKLTKAHEQAARAHLGEASVQAPAFAGKILTGNEARQNAETLSRAFNAQYGDLDRILMSVNKVNAIERYFMLAGDASALTIQLIGFSVRFPRIWSKSAVNFSKALFSEKSQAAYLAKNNDIVQKSRNLILTKGGQTEYTEAFRSGGLLSKGPAKLLIPFQRGFEAAMDTAGIELRKAFDHLADTPQHTAEVEQFINEFRGVTSSARIGVSPQLRQFETAVFLAPRYNRAVAALLSDATRGGIRGDQARKAILALIGGSAALAVAVTLARGEGWEAIADHLNPQSANFMTWEIAGQRIGPGAKFRSLMALAGKITKEPERTVELAANFIRAQFAPLLSTSIDIINGRDYVGEPTRPGKPLGFGKEVGFAEGMLGLSRRVIADNLLPLSLNSFLMEGGDFAGRATRGVIEFAGGRAYPSRTDEAKDVIDKAFIQLGKEDEVGLEAALKGMTNSKKIAEIRAKDHTYDITSLRRDISDAIRYINAKDITEKNGFNPLASVYVEFDKVDDEYEALSIKEREQYVKDNPDYITNRLFWGDSNLTTIPSLKTAEALAAKAEKYGIELDMIPAFQKTERGKERIPSDKNLWKAYFDYNDLPGSSYLNLTQVQVDAGKLPEKYRKEWETYHKLKTDAAKDAFKKYRNKKGQVAYGGWRDDFRRANKELDKWLQENKDMKPLKKGRTSKANIRPQSASSLFGGFSRPSSRRKKLAMPKFPKSRVLTGAGAPRAPRV